MTVAQRITTTLLTLCISMAAAAGAAAGVPVPPAEDLLLLSAPDDPLMFGTAGSGESSHCYLDGDGSHAVFTSEAAQLVAGDRNGNRDVFIRDMLSGSLERLNRYANGSENPHGAQGPSISNNGRYVAFETADDLINNSAGTFNTQSYVLDRSTGTVQLASRRPDGLPGNQRTNSTQISRNGRYVVFASAASDLVAGDTNGNVVDTFVFDAQTGTVVRASTDAAGVEANAGGYQAAVSNNGRYVAFESDASNLVPNDLNGKRDVFVKDLSSGAIERVSVSTAGAEGNQGADFMAMSRNGDIVLFSTRADNLVVGDSNNGSDQFIRRRAAGTTERVNVDAMGNQTLGAADGWITADGSQVVFESTDATLAGPTNGVTQVFVKDLASGVVSKLTDLPAAHAVRSRISGDGLTMCYETLGPGGAATDTDQLRDVIAVDIIGATATVLSASPIALPLTGGTERSVDVDMSGDGRFAVFTSEAVLDGETLAAFGVLRSRQIYLRDSDNNIIILVSADALGEPADSQSVASRISADGRYVVYQSRATNLDPAAASGAAENVYRWDGDSDSTELISVDAMGIEVGGQNPDVDGDGDRAVFRSASAVFVDDSNGEHDVFLWDQLAGLVPISVSLSGDYGNDASGEPAISADGRFVAFSTRADNLVAGSSGNNEIILRDLELNTLQRISAPSGVAPNGHAYEPTVSGDGMRIAFVSSASNLVAADPNGGDYDVFITERAAGSILRVPVERELLPGGSYNPSKLALSDDGSHLLFWMIDDDQPGNGGLLLRYDISYDRVVVLTGYPGSSGIETDDLSAKLSANGSIAAMTTPAALLPDDINGQGIPDAYRLNAETLGDNVFNDSFE